MYFFIFFQYYAITETTAVREINPVTLETGPRVDTTDFVAVHTQTGHPHTDRDGTSYVMGTQFGRETNYVFYKIPKGGSMKDLTIVGKSAGIFRKSSFEINVCQQQTHWNPAIIILLL